LCDQWIGISQRMVIISVHVTRCHGVPSIGKPAFFQAEKPPIIELTLV
jgi:hypothetical protein